MTDEAKIREAFEAAVPPSQRQRLEEGRYLYGMVQMEWLQFNRGYLAGYSARPESEAERAIVEYVAIDEALDKPCAEWTNEECNRHRKASQALKDLARKLAGEATTKGE